jgi:pyruvate/2-oxoglutarate dehydrogenase complex dihydrolipoamide acyltransferase (E2) component
MDEKNFEVVPIPASRKVIVDAGRLASRRHIIHGLLEIDVTAPHLYIRNHKVKTGETLSFTAFLVKCLAQAINANPSVQAYRNWRNQLVIFHEVDVVTMIETKLDHVAVPHIIRNANSKTFRQIHDEIRFIQESPRRSAQTGGLVDLAQHVPAFGRDLFYWLVRQNPHWAKQIQGTVILTSVGMFGKKSGYGVGFLPYHTLGLTIGGISQKPGVVNGQIEIRDYLNLTISFDHDIVDGAPAARFAKKLSDLVESEAVLLEG